MDGDGLSAALALLLAASLATERLVAVLKTAFPRLLAEESGTGAGEVDRVADRPRRLAVQALAFAAAWLVTAVLAPGEAGLTGDAFFASLRAGELRIPAPVLALLASGGSAFWSQVVQWAGAHKDRALTRGSAERLAFRRRMQSLGLAPAEVRRGRDAADARAFLLQRLRAVAPRSPAPAAEPAP